MKIGYACQTVGVLGTKQSTCIQKSASPALLYALIQQNLCALSHILDYNYQNNIKLFRISSDIIPFGSHPVNELQWEKDFCEPLRVLGKKALALGMRLSMHPGQYTVLNSPDKSIVKRAVEDLEYHCRFLDALGLPREHKLILHIGGVYGDKRAALERFCREYRLLDSSVRSRLVIENDDRHYSAADTLAIGEQEGIPVVFDILHHQIHPDKRLTDAEWILACKKTWKSEDGRQKLHFSQQEPGRRSGSHALTVDVSGFLGFLARLPADADIMVEVKDKNLSAVKCLNAMALPDIGRLKKEWEKYRCLLLEHSPRICEEIPKLLQYDDAYPVALFYKLIDKALRTPPTSDTAGEAAQQIWDAVQDSADSRTRARYDRLRTQLLSGGSPLPLKRFLLRLAEEMNLQLVLDSYYFSEVI